MMKNEIFVLTVLVAKRPDKNVKVNLKFNDVAAWLTNSYTYCPVS